MADKLKNNIGELARTTGINISELARRLDMQPHTLRRYSRNEIQPKPKLTLALAEVFGCDPSQVVGFQPTNGSSEPPLGRIPLYGSQSMRRCVDMVRAIDHIARPPCVMKDSNAYAVYMTCDTMEPRFNMGDILYVDPDSPVKKQSDVFVLFQSDTDPLLKGVVGKFESTDNQTVILMLLNGSESLRLDKTKVTGIHAIRGSALS